ncbi:MAG: transposase [bacterium]
MVNRKEPLVDNHVYHVFTRSIAEYNIFRSDNDFQRFINTINYYSAEIPPCKFSGYLRLFDKSRSEIMATITNSAKIVKILSFCIMPTHLHLVLEQLKENGISKFVNTVLISYSKYFNTKYERKGPLWEGRFKNVLVETNEQLLHLTRYVHLNPVTASIIKKPEDWKYSSFKEYTQDECAYRNKICSFSHYLDIKPEEYRQFVHERIDYQKELQMIKHCLLE